MCTIIENMMHFKVVLEEDEEVGGYIVSCPGLPGCFSQGGGFMRLNMTTHPPKVQGLIKILYDKSGLPYAFMPLLCH